MEWEPFEWLPRWSGTSGSHIDEEGQRSSRRSQTFSKRGVGWTPSYLHPIKTEQTESGGVPFRHRPFKTIKRDATANGVQRGTSGWTSGTHRVNTRGWQRQQEDTHLQVEGAHHSSIRRRHAHLQRNWNSFSASHHKQRLHIGRPLPAANTTRRVRCHLRAAPSFPTSAEQLE